MVNLLPKSAQNALRTTYYLRLLTSTLVLLGLVVLVGAVLLAPTYLLIHADADEATRYVETLTDIADQRAASGGAATVTALNASINLLDTAYQEPRLGSALVAITSAVPAGVSVDSVTTAFSDDGTAALTLSGIAATRSALIKFGDQLKATRGMSGVSVPVAALVAETNNAFTMTMQYKTP